MAKNATDLPDLTHYKDAYLTCRSIGHRWPDPRFWHWASVRGPRGRILSYRRTMSCARCKVVGIDVIDAGNGDKSPRQYRHPEDYLRPSGHGFDRGEMRLEQIRRVMDRGAIFDVIDVDGIYTEAEIGSTLAPDVAEAIGAGRGDALSHASDGSL